MQRTKLTEGIAGKTFIIQGFGNVGYWFAKFVQKDGGKVIGIIEHDCAIYNEDGFDVDDVKLHMTINGTIHDYNKARKTTTMDPTDFMKYECDVFAPCAGDSTININNANDIKAKIVIEGANGPTTFKADQILSQKGI